MHQLGQDHRLTKTLCGFQVDQVLFQAFQRVGGHEYDDQPVAVVKKPCGIDPVTVLAKLPVADQDLWDQLLGGGERLVDSRCDRDFMAREFEITPDRDGGCPVVVEDQHTWFHSAELVLLVPVRPDANWMPSQQRRIATSSCEYRAVPAAGIHEASKEFDRGVETFVNRTEDALSGRH